MMHSEADSCSVSCNLVFQISSNKWHARFAHPSKKILVALKDILPEASFSNVVSDTCLVCPLAKQRRLSVAPFLNCCIVMYGGPIKRQHILVTDIFSHSLMTILGTPRCS